MKTVLVSFLILGSTLTTARAAAASDFSILDTLGDSIVTQVICQDNREVRDDGLSVVIQSGGFVGITTAVVSRLTFAGSQQLGSVPVERNEDSARHPGLVAFNGEKFRLVINTTEIHNNFSPAIFKAKVAGHTVTEELICRLSK